MSPLEPKRWIIAAGTGVLKSHWVEGRDAAGGIRAKQWCLGRHNDADLRRSPKGMRLSATLGSRAQTRRQGLLEAQGGTPVFVIGTKLAHDGISTRSIQLERAPVASLHLEVHRLAVAAKCGSFHRLQ